MVIFHGYISLPEGNMLPYLGTIKVPYRTINWYNQKNITWLLIITNNMATG